MTDAITRVVIDERDADRLLRTLYNDKPHQVHILICLCGATADLYVSSRAWNGWQVLPTAKCPVCLEKAWCAAVLMEDYDGPAREKFFLRMRELLS
jgi:hypothetical protein